MAACWLEPRKSDAYEAQVPICLHIERSGQSGDAGSSPISGCCSTSCENFVKDFARRIMDITLWPHRLLCRHWLMSGQLCFFILEGEGVLVTFEHILGCLLLFTCRSNCNHHSTSPFLYSVIIEISVYTPQAILCFRTCFYYAARVTNAASVGNSLPWVHPSDILKCGPLLGWNCNIWIFKNSRKTGPH